MYMEQSLKQALQTDDLIAQACAYRGLGEIGSIQNPEESHENFLQAIALLKRQAIRLVLKRLENC